MLAKIYSNPYIIKSGDSDASEPVSLRSVEVIAMHSSIYDRFVKNHGVEEFMSYQKTREVCSLDDMAMNAVMVTQINDFFQNWLVGNPDYNYRYVDEGFRTRLTDAERVEFNQVISFHTKQSHVVDSVEAFLKPKAYEKKHEIGSYGNDCEAISLTAIAEKAVVADSYRVVAYQSSIYIVVEEGFLEQMEDNASKLKFVSTILKAAYAVMPINTVNQSEWYGIYLDALRVSTPQ